MNRFFLSAVIMALMLTFISCEKENDNGNDTIPVADVLLDKSELLLMVGSTEVLNETVLPENATNKKVTWESSNNAIASVDNTGKITAKTEGVVNITVKTEDGNHTANCKLTINLGLATGITLNKTTLSLGMDASEQLEATIVPTNAKNKTIEWSSSNTSVATVSNGIVTAINTGTAIITARTEDGNHTANCELTVNVFGGDGLTASTAFQISTAKQLALLSELINSETAPYASTGIYYKLTENIDLSDYQNDAGWIPIGRINQFRGNFDGNNHTVSNLKINYNDTDIYNNTTFTGLFGYITGAIKSLGVVNANINGDRYVGGIAGFVEMGGRIENCYVTGVINGNATVGGIAGWVFNSITGCYSDVSVTGDSDIGGVAGGIQGNISNCYSSGTVSGNENIGGIVGYVRADASYSIDNCYAISAVSGNNNVGGVAGLVYDQWNGGKVNVTNCAALNVSIMRNSGESVNFGRVAGNANVGLITGNVAWSGMTINGGLTFSGDIRDGIGKTKDEISSNSAFSEMFTNPIWTKATNRLPGLFGQTVVMPQHLK